MNFVKQVAKIIHIINRWVANISIGVLFIMVFFVAADVIGRYLLSKPILGGMEIQELMMVLIIFLAMGLATYDKQHVIVEILIVRLKGRTLRVINCISLLLTLIFVTLLVWQTLKTAINDLTSQTPTITSMLSIPVAPFIFMATSGLLFMALEFLIELVITIKQSFSTQSETFKRGGVQDG